MSDLQHQKLAVITPLPHGHVHTTSSSSHSVLRIISEDPRLRPFLSTHFDPATFIASTVQSNLGSDAPRARLSDATVANMYTKQQDQLSATPTTANAPERMLTFITSMIEDTNREIQTYISQHKDELMAGMQDIAMFADQCKVLHDWIMQVQKSVEMLKTEVMVPYNKVTERTRELENIHATNVMLKKVRQFLTNKAALDQQFTIPLNATPQETDLHELAAAARILSELEALIEEPGLQRVDIVQCQIKSVKTMGEKVRTTAQEVLLSAFKEKNQAGMALALQVFFHLQALPEVTLMVLDRAIQEIVETSVDIFDLERVEKSVQDNITASQSNPSPKKDKDTEALRQRQLRDEIRELCSIWSQFVFEKALQIQALARVLVKKEDPFSRRRFCDVLISGHHSTLFGNGIFHVFWQRLATRIADVFAEKLKTHPTTATRIYPSVRRTVTAMFAKLQDSAPSEADRELHNGLRMVRNADIASNNIGATGDHDGVFGGLFVEDEYDSTENVLSVLSSWRHQPKPVSAAANSLQILPEHSVVFLEGLSPLRDRYLATVLQQITAPVHMMFPQLDGYQAAIPSRHDLQAFTKAIQSELLSAFQEGDQVLITLTCNQVIKAVQLLTTKAEVLVLTTPNALCQNKTTDFQRSHDQEHNVQLAVLINLLEQSLLTLPDALNKRSRAHSDEDIDFSARAQEVAQLLQPAISSLIDLQLNQILLPVVTAATEVVQEILSKLHQEAFGAEGRNIDSLSMECSGPIKELAATLPKLVENQLSAFPYSLARNAAMKEFACRVISSYISFAALLRPLSETGRLRCTKDATSIEELLTGYCKLSSENPVYNEFRSFRRLLFWRESATGLDLAADKAKLLSYEFLPSLRPSTLLHHLVSSSPPQLASPFIQKGVSVLEYVSALVQPQRLQDTMSSATYIPLATVQGLYSHYRNRTHPEMENWFILQEALDVYVQRITASSERQSMRDWYEFIMEIGSMLFTR